MKKTALFAAALLLASCSKPPVDPASFPQLEEEFTYSTLALNPVAATSAGLHEYQGKSLDTILDDYSPAGVETSRKHFNDWKARIASMDTSKLDAEARADIALMNGQIALGLLELDTIQNYRHNPTVYVELVGNAIFTPFSVEYAPADKRWRDIIARLKAVPTLVGQAKQQLVDTNPTWSRVAIQENEGNLGLIEQTLPAQVPEAMKADYAAAAKPAADALRDYNAFVKTLKDLGPEGWRMGEAKYDQQFRLVVDSSVTPEQLLADAEAEVTAIRKRMFDVALPLHKKFYPTHRDPVDLNLIVGETLNRIAQDHAKPADYFASAEKSLEETRAFVRAHEAQILKLPGQDNLKLIETPTFMRGIYGVGGFSQAPALQPELGAFYWLTPFGKDWPQERIESKLREYNRYGLQILTIHEAIPGHYVQFEYANAVEPKPRRVLRAIFGSGVYVEGWAVYATDVMLAEGYMDHSPEMELTWGKQLLRAVANTILDIRFHTMNMTDEEGLKLMVERTFQEKEEATAKLQRAKLSSCQLPTYYAGYRGWKQLRAAAAKQQGKEFAAGKFHERALSAGPLPLNTLANLMGIDATAKAKADQPPASAPAKK